MRHRQAGAVGAGLLLALLGAAGVAPAEDGDPVVALEPTTGTTDSGAVNVVTDRPCPAEATNVVVRIAGAGFPEDSNAVGNTEISVLPRPQTGDGLVIPLFGSWEVVAASNGSSQALEGDARMTLLCLGDLGTQIVSEMAGDVRFERADGAAAGRYSQIGGPEIVTGTIPTAEPAGTWEDGAPPSEPGVQEQPPYDPGTQLPAEDPPAADGELSVEPPVEGDGEAGADQVAQGAAAGAPTGSEPAAMSNASMSNTASETPVDGGSRTALVVGAGVLALALAGGAAAYGRPRRPTGAGPPT
jgi:hypothetical protein